MLRWLTRLTEVLRRSHDRRLVADAMITYQRARARKRDRLLLSHHRPRLAVVYAPGRLVGLACLKRHRYCSNDSSVKGRWSLALCSQPLTYHQRRS